MSQANLNRMFLELEDCHYNLTQTREFIESKGLTQLGNKEIAEKIEGVMNALYHAANCQQSANEFCSICTTTKGETT